MANAIRALAMDAVEQAKSGHPGLPMGAADIATVLFTQFLKHDPADPKWPDRDRFVLSAGHGSMLLYALLYLTGNPDMTLEQIKQFRQLDSLMFTGPAVSDVSTYAHLVVARLYERLGGVFAIAAVVDHFSDAVVQNPRVGKTSENQALREWHTRSLGRLPGLKFMRTLWVCQVSGGPFKFSATKPGKTELGLEEAHRQLKISPEEFDEVAAELGRSLDHVKVPAREKDEVLEAFAAHKGEVTAGYKATN